MAVHQVKTRNVWYTRAPQLLIIIGNNPMVVLLNIQIDILVIAVITMKLQLNAFVKDEQL